MKNSIPEKRKVRSDWKYWYEVTEYPDDLAPEVHFFYGRKNRARARRLAKQLSELGIEVWIDGYDLAEQWKNGKKVLNR